MDIQAYCDKSQTIHAVSVLKNQQPPPPVPSDCDESFWIEKVSFGSQTYNVASRFKRRYMPRITLENGVTIVMSFKLSEANGHE